MSNEAKLVKMAKVAYFQVTVNQLTLFMYIIGVMINGVEFDIVLGLWKSHKSYSIHWTWYYCCSSRFFCGLTFNMYTKRILFVRSKFDVNIRIRFDSRFFSVSHFMLHRLLTHPLIHSLMRTCTPKVNTFFLCKTKNCYLQFDTSLFLLL